MRKKDKLKQIALNNYYCMFRIDGRARSVRIMAENEETAKEEILTVYPDAKALKISVKNQTSPESII